MLTPMREARGRLLATVMFALGMAGPASARAQGSFEIQVYPSETVAPGATMIELHSNSALKGTTSIQDGVVPSQHAAHETIEITHGFTDWFETGFYIFTSVQPDTGWEWVGNHLRPRVRVPERWEWPVGLSLSLEVGYQRRAFSVDTWTLELRPIVDKQLGPWYVSLNPVLERSLKGQSSGKGFEFAPSAKIAYDVTSRIAVGLEYYGALGPLTGFDRARDQQHQIFPVIDLNLGPRWEFNLGVGFGLTRSTDSVTVKLILGRRFGGAEGK
jgi:hypothetical protein